MCLPGIRTGSTVQTQTNQPEKQEKNKEIQVKTEAESGLHQVPGENLSVKDTKQGKAAATYEMSPPHSFARVFVQTGAAAVSYGLRAQACAPVVGTAIGVAITAWDVKDALEKTRDPKVGKTSAALAWATVGFDVAATATTATGILAPLGVELRLLTMGTSFLSDIAIIANAY
jgi:hypothetical protein